MASLPFLNGCVFTSFEEATVRSLSPPLVEGGWKQSYTGNLLELSINPWTDADNPRLAITIRNLNSSELRVSVTGAFDSPTSPACHLGIRDSKGYFWPAGNSLDSARLGEEMTIPPLGSLCLTVPTTLLGTTCPARAAQQFKFRVLAECASVQEELPVNLVIGEVVTKYGVVKVIGH